MVQRTGKASLEQYARLGAEIRLRELADQERVVRQLLKDLGDGKTSVDLPELHQTGTPALSTADDLPSTSTPRKLHWTQRPENRALVLRTMKKANRARRRKAHA